jgi:IS30 family transposase
MIGYNHKYTQLTTAERIKIETLAGIGKNAAKISRILNRSASTISRELRHGRYKAQYHAHIAQKRATQIRGRRPKTLSNASLMHTIERMIKERLSPAIIAQMLCGAVSHTTIYTLTSTSRPEWRKYLIYQKKTKYRKGSGDRSLIPNRRDISDRPAVEYGDWEADTVISSRGGKSCIAVFAEKTTRLYRAVKMPDKSARSMARAAIKALSGFYVRSITYDNGSENVKHEVVNRVLGSESWFCRPYRSCDKGLVENRNKWLRVWLPKRTNFDLISEDEIGRVESAINKRPMKCLGWQSPADVFQAKFLHFIL